MIWSAKVIDRWSENKFYFTNCKGCRKYGYADIRILCSTAHHKNKGLFGKGLILFHVTTNQMWLIQLDFFLKDYNKSLPAKENAGYHHFLLFPQYFQKAFPKGLFQPITTQYRILVH